MEKKNKIAPFELMDCALITLTTGKSAINLRELRDRIAEAPESSLYYHLYENMLRPGFDDPEYRNDFALWASGPCTTVVWPRSWGYSTPFHAATWMISEVSSWM